MGQTQHTSDASSGAKKHNSVGLVPDAAGFYFHFLFLNLFHIQKLLLPEIL